jgi:hypothetical protein
MLLREELPTGRKYVFKSYSLVSLVSRLGGQKRAMGNPHKADDWKTNIVVYGVFAEGGGKYHISGTGSNGSFCGFIVLQRF